jgi:hypothetical protein
MALQQLDIKDEEEATSPDHFPIAVHRPAHKAGAPKVEVFDSELLELMSAALSAGIATVRLVGMDASQDARSSMARRIVLEVASGETTRLSLAEAALDEWIAVHTRDEMVGVSPMASEDAQLGTVNTARQQQVALSQAFELACRELGIGQGSLDVWKSERLTRRMSRIASGDDWDPQRLGRRAILTFEGEVSDSPTRRRYA